MIESSPKPLEPRLAVDSDRPFIEHLWMALLREGTTIYLPTDRNLKNFMSARDNIMNQYVDGVVVVVPDIAVHMSGDIGLSCNFDTALKDTIYGLGTYVIPAYRSKGLYAKIIKFAGLHLRELGYEKIYAEIRSNNLGAHKAFTNAGGKPVAVSYELDIS